MAGAGISEHSPAGFEEARPGLLSPGAVALPGFRKRGFPRLRRTQIPSHQLRF
jgi:hypothetical protein